MSRLVTWGFALAVWLCAGAAVAQGARLLDVAEGFWGAVTVEIGVPEAVPHRVFMRTGPPRLIVDVQVPEASGGVVTVAPLRAVRAGALDGEWSRFVFDLDPVYAIDEVLLDDKVLRLRLARSGPRAFEAAVVETAMPDAGGVQRRVRAPDPGRVRIVLDPGHGGVDPGAVRAGVAEKDVALAFAGTLATVLEASGRYEVLMTRRDDRFVTLDDRVAFARAARARLFLSLHANTVTEGVATGATVYLPATIATDPRSAALAVLENRADLAGGAASLPDGEIARTVLSLAQRSTPTRARAAAEHVVAGLALSAGIIRSRPLRGADFRVLRAPDVPSLLLEMGFLSHAGDRAKMTSDVWRRQVAEALLVALDNWVEQDAERLSLMAR